MIRIRKHTREDISYKLKWLSDPYVRYLIGEKPNKKANLKEELKWFKDYEKKKNKKFFTICDNKTPIGFMGLSYIDKVNNNSDLFIIIGDKNYRGKGFGRKVMMWLLDYGFKKLKLHKIKLQVMEKNTSAIRLYESLGFKNEGKMKGEVYFNGRYYNLITMAKFNK